jgi:hypothetical protein
MVPRRIAFASLLLALLLGPVVAYPTRAGHCESGARIGEASGGVHGRQGSGSLEDGNFAVSVNGTILNGFDVLELVAGENYTVIIKGGSDPFRGVLLRVAGINGEDLVDSLVVVDANTQLLPSTGETSGFESACADDVSGLCHNSRIGKANITAELRLPEEDADVLVEVTIVTNNEGGGSNDWYYGSYQLNVTVQMTNTTTNSTTNSTTDEEEGTNDGGVKDSPGACKWYCSLIPTPWLSEEPGDHPKCDWTFSCSACEECQTEARLR